MSKEELKMALYDILNDVNGIPGPRERDREKLQKKVKALIKRGE